jgi:hypothetical protein
MNRSHARSLFSRLAGRRRVLAFILAVPLSTMLGACGSSGQGTRAATAPPVRNDAATVRAATNASGSPQVSCGAAAPATLAKTAGIVAMQIYAHELSGSGVRADQHQVESYRPLLSALASGNQAAIREAVSSLVYSHTHIVRLRVVEGGTVRADIGGPYIIAPVSGSLRFHGRTVGHYLLSVQDDLGYVKLETRYVGLPLVLQMGALRIPLEGTLAGAPASIPNLGPVTYRGTSYEAFSFDAQAFPQSRVRVSLLVPVPPSLAATSTRSGASRGG